MDDVRPDLLAVATVVVTERSGFLSGRSHDLTAPDGEPLATLTEEVSTGSWIFGSAASSRFVLAEPRGALLAMMERPGSFPRAGFLVTDHDGCDVGEVEQLPGQFVLIDVDGTALRLIGGRRGPVGAGRPADRHLLDEEDRILGRTTADLPALAGLLPGARRFAVQLSPELTGPARLLAMMVGVCADLVRDTQGQDGRISLG
jgi:hypothetical protein